MFDQNMLNSDVIELLTLKRKRENCKNLLLAYLNDILDVNADADKETIFNLQYELNDLNKMIEFYESLVMLNLTYNLQISNTKFTHRHISQLNDTKQLSGTD